LQTRHRRSARKSDVALALLEHAPEINPDTLYGLTLTLMDGKSPREDERNLVARYPVRERDSEQLS
jgi:hypothetical protein